MGKPENTQLSLSHVQRRQMAWLIPCALLCFAGLRFLGSSGDKAGLIGVIVACVGTARIVDALWPYKYLVLNVVLMLVMRFVIANQILQEPFRQDLSRIFPVGLCFVTIVCVGCVAFMIGDGRVRPGEE